MALDLSGLSQQDQMQKAADFAGVPSSVISGMLHTESDGNNAAVSSAGAQGAFQVMPKTQATWEQRLGRTFDPHNFTDSLTMAAYQMRENVAATQGNIPDALRMYNAGPDRSKWNNPETRAYAAKVLGTDDDFSGYAAKGIPQMDPNAAWTTSAYDLKNAQAQQLAGVGNKQWLSDVEKGIVSQAGTEAAVNAVVTGNGDQAATDAEAARQAVKANPTGVADSAITALGQQPVGTGNDQTGWANVQARQAASEQQFAKDDAVTLGDKFKAAFDQNTLTAAIGRAIANSQTWDHASHIDPNFHNTYMQNIDQIENGMDQSEVESLRQAVNPQDLRRIQFQIAQQRQDAQTVAAGSGTGERVGLGLAAGFVDPAGWIAGLGVGKVAQLAGVGAREAFQAGKTVRGITYSGLEGSAGNLLMTATMDAAGQHQSINDYAHAAGFGFLMGAGFSGMHMSGPAKQAAQDDMANLGKTMQDSAATANADLYTKAQAEAGPQASPAEVVQAADKVQLDQAQALHDTMFSDGEPDQKIAPPLEVADTGKLVAPQDTVKPVTDEPITNSTWVLPEDLGGATPNYSFGSKKFKLDFANDVDKAGYIIAQKNPSKRDADYLNFVQTALGGVDEDTARGFGAAVRATIKDQAKDAQPGTLKVEQQFNTQPKESAGVNNASGESSASVEAQNRVRDEKEAGQQRMVIEPDGSVRPLMGTVDDVDTFAREGQIIAQKGVGKDEWTAISHDPSFSKDYVRSRVENMKDKLNSHSVEDDVENYGEHYLDMDGDYDEPGALFSRQEEPSHSVEGDVEDEGINSAEAVKRRTLPYDQVRQTVFGDIKDQNRLFPRPEVNTGRIAELGADGHLPGSVLDTPAKLADVVKRYDLDVKISDPAERRLVAETIARSENVNAANPVTKEVHPALEKVGWEATSTSLLNDKSPVSQAAAKLLLENPEGVAGRRVTASMTASMREKAYMGNVLGDYENHYLNFRRRNGGSAVKDFMGGDLRRSFDKEVYEYRDRQFMGKPEKEHVPQEVKDAAKVLDDGYKRMNDDQIYAGTVGSARLTAGGVDGYQPRRMSAGMVAGLKGPQLRAAVEALAEEFNRTAGMDKDFAREFAVKYLERARGKAKGAFDVSMNLHDPQTASAMRDSLRSLSLSEEQISSIIGRFSKGGASHTKNRIDMDLTTSYPDGAGGNLRMMDMMNTDNLALYRQYARRVAGETALAKYGIMGENGLSVLRQAIKETDGSNEALRAFDQVAAEFLGKPFGTAQSKWADRALLLTSAMRLGGMGFAQFAEYTNGLAALGVSGTFKAIASMPRLYGEIRSGKPSELLKSFATYGGDIGHEEYRMHGMYDVNQGYEIYGKDTLNVVDKGLRLGAQFNRVASFQRAIMAMQQRGVAEQIVQKSLQYIKAGTEDKALLDMGFTPEVQEAIRADLSKIAKFDNNGVKEFDITKMQDTDAAHAYMQAVYRGASQIIQHTYIGESGKWAHDGWLRLLTQFRAYGLTATQKQWGRNRSTYGTAKALGYLLGAMSVAVPVQMARIEMRSVGHKDRDKFIDQNMNPMALGRATMNYVAATGVLGDVLDIGSSAFGLSVTGGRAGNNSDFVGGQILPAVGALNDTAKAVTGALSYPIKAATGQPRSANQAAHDVIKLLPGSNLPYLQAAINQLDQ